MPSNSNRQCEKPLTEGWQQIQTPALFFISTHNADEGRTEAEKNMMEITTPTSVTLYVQWIPHPFPTPHTAEQKSRNSKWALDKTKELLTVNSIDSANVKLAKQFNGLVLLEILDPSVKDEEGKEFWETVLDLMISSKEVESISIYVCNDTSEKIAVKLADRVPTPWHTGYNGYNEFTKIYHR